MPRPSHVSFKTMKYKNIKNGAVIDVSSEIKGGDWIPVDETPETVEKPAPAKRRKETVKK